MAHLQAFAPFIRTILISGASFKVDVSIYRTFHGAISWHMYVQSQTIGLFFLREMETEVKIQISKTMHGTVL